VEVYRRLTGCRSEASLDDAEREILDRFGTMPAPVAGFLRTMRVKLRAAAFDLASVSPGKEGVIVKYRDRKKAEEFTKRDPQAIRIMDDETILIVGRDVLDLLKPGK
jgi:transcription-repair coupling factor (superfamily II helicase)